MRDYDRLDLTNCGLILPWNEEDGETAARREELTGVLMRTMPLKAGVKKSAQELMSVQTPSELREAMERMLTMLRLRIIEESVVRRQIESVELSLRARELGLSIDSLPSISGPGELKE